MCSGQRSLSFCVGLYHSNTKVVKEHVIIISDNGIQDNNSVYKVQGLLNTNLTKDLGQQITVMQGFTDGCAAQCNCKESGDCYLLIP